MSLLVGLELRGGPGRLGVLIYWWWWWWGGGVGVLNYTFGRGVPPKPSNPDPISNS